MPYEDSPSPVAPQAGSRLWTAGASTGIAIAVIIGLAVFQPDLASWLLGGAALLAVLVWQVEPLRVRVLSLVAGREDSSNNFRINVWLAVLDMIQSRPLLGIGPGNDAFNLIYPLYQQPRFNALSAYSIPLELTVEAGVPGLLAGLGLVAFSLRRALRLWRGDGPWALPALGVMAVIAALGVQGLTDTIFFRPEVQLTGWFCLATLAAAPNTD